MSLAFASTCVFGYVLVSHDYVCPPVFCLLCVQDCYPRLAEEAFVAINTRNILTFGLVSSQNTVPLWKTH